MMALPMNSLYSLTWGDYGTSLVSAIQLLRCHGDLVDCTLAAGGRSFPAHKIVLCAASPFLLELLKNTPCKHPVVMLAGVNANDLEALLEFVYRGEVSVDHAQLPSLLQAAQCLNIQGLAPQTVTKDDYTTHSIQLQHMIPQHHHEQDQLIATIATAPQQTVHAQVVEDIHQTGQLLQTQTTTTGQQTIVGDDTQKDVIQQFLPARKRKPRVKKMTPTSAKVAKVDGMETIIAATNSNHASSQHQLQPTQQQNIENGAAGHMMTSTPHIKTEMQKVETIVSMDAMTPIGNTNDSTVVSTATPKAKRVKNTSGTDKPRSRSQSEQPATCPICYAVIRQSRNLRRHLELRHFAKPGVKKEKKSKSDDADITANSSATATNDLSASGYISTSETDNTDLTTVLGTVMAVDDVVVNNQATVIASTVNMKSDDIRHSSTAPLAATTATITTTTTTRTGNIPAPTTRVIKVLQQNVKRRPQQQQQQQQQHQQQQQQHHPQQHQHQQQKQGVILTSINLGDSGGGVNNNRNIIGVNGETITNNMIDSVETVKVTPQNISVVNNSRNSMGQVTVLLKPNQQMQHIQQQQNHMIHIVNNQQAYA